MKLIKNKYILLLLIIVIGAFLRFYNLSKVPSGFIQDEALYGYDSYSILETGKDHNNNSPGLFLEGFSKSLDNRSSLYLYATIPAVKIFGLNEFAVRFPAALFGVICILITYLLVKEITKNKYTSLVASFLVSISPWHISLSRIGIEEGSFTTFFLITSFYFLIRGIHKKNWFFILGCFIAGINFYSYAIIKPFITLMVVGLIYIYKEDIKKMKKIFTIGTIIFFITLIPFLLNLLTNPTYNAFKYISIFSNDFWPFIFIFNYLNHFVFTFFFQDNFMWPQLVGKIHLTTFILFLSAISAFIFKKQLIKKDYKFLLLWLILFPVGSALVKFGYEYIFRPVSAIPVFEILASIFFIKITNNNILKSKAKKIIFCLISLTLMIEVLASNYNYLFKASTVSSFYQYGLKDSLLMIGDKKLSESKIYITEKTSNNLIAQNYIFILFFNKYSPEVFQKNEKDILEGKDQWREVKTFANYEFGNIEDKFRDNKKGIYIAFKDELTHVTPHKNIYFPNGDIAYKIIYNE